MLFSNPLRGIRTHWLCNSCRLLSTRSKYAPIPKRLPSNPARTRFAPSPTGYLHLGSLRTALFNYLLAKATGGQFIIRIEDTDQKRIVSDAEERLYRDLKWAGLSWDEGPDVGGPFGPYKQSQRTSIYQNSANQLVQSRHAYRCFCPVERLKDLAKRHNELKLPGSYDRTCLRLSRNKSETRFAAGERHVIRLKSPNCYSPFNDIVHGMVGEPVEGRPKLVNQEAYEDPILIKSDGQPTYHLANVVDDHLMKITHVIRAAEWMSSTPRHIFLHKALGWKAPEYAHVGLLQNAQGEKFSKRNEDLDLPSFERKGIFPEALINYVALFGWSHKLGDDFLRMEDLIKNFSFKFTKGNTVVAPDKLYHLQKKYAIKYAQENGKDFDLMVESVYAIAEESMRDRPRDPAITRGDPKLYIKTLLRHSAARYTTPGEFFTKHLYFFHPVVRDPHDFETDPSALSVISDQIDAVNDRISQVSVDSWTESRLRAEVNTIISDIAAHKIDHPDQEANHLHLKSVGKVVNKYLRWAITGGLSGPGMPITMELLGRDITLERLEEAKAELKKVQEKGLSEQVLDDGSRNTIIFRGYLVDTAGYIVNWRS